MAWQLPSAARTASTGFGPVSLPPSSGGSSRRSSNPRTLEVVWRLSAVEVVVARNTALAAEGVFSMAFCSSWTAVLIWSLTWGPWACRSGRGAARSPAGRRDGRGWEG
jgi:hypothetical protein